MSDLFDDGFAREPYATFTAWSDYPHVMAAWRRSHVTLDALRSAFAKTAVPASVAHLAVSGSLGRMEQTGRSDADIIVTLHENVSRTERQGVMDYVLGIVDQVGIPRPLSSGVFAEPVSRVCLLDHQQRGKISTDRVPYGHRIQLLLDAQPLWADQAFRETQRAVLRWFAQSPGNAARDSSEVMGRRTIWRYLNNEVLRYYRCLDVEVQWKTWTVEAEREEAERKLAASRRVLIAGLILLLGESLTDADPVDHVARHLVLTPLERMVWAFQQRPSPPLPPLLRSYDQFLGWMHRRSATSPDNYAESMSGASSASATEEQIDGFTIARGLLDYLAMRRGDWPDEFLASCWI